MSMNVNSPTRTRNVDSKKAKAADSKKFSPCTLSRTNDKMRQQAEASKVRHIGQGQIVVVARVRVWGPTVSHLNSCQRLRPEPPHPTPSRPPTYPSLQRKRTGGAKKVEKKTRATPVARRTRSSRVV